ncbi:hypothetical protein YTPLAS21_17390 [Candidatus Nitrosocosmicus sp.]|nr:hypothetical protein YTPLAS21_17390 [Candidatus Nitrosocosmicus sp.]
MPKEEELKVFGNSDWEEADTTLVFNIVGTIIDKINTVKNKVTILDSNLSFNGNC